MKKLNFFAIALLFAGAVACNNVEEGAENAADQTEEVVEEAAEKVEETTEEVIEVVSDSTAAATEEVVEGEEAHDHAEGEDHDH